MPTSRTAQVPWGRIELVIVLLFLFLPRRKDISFGQQEGVEEILRTNNKDICWSSQISPLFSFSLWQRDLIGISCLSDLDVLISNFLIFQQKFPIPNSNSSLQIPISNHSYLTINIKTNPHSSTIWISSYPYSILISICNPKVQSQNTHFNLAVTNPSPNLYTQPQTTIPNQKFHFPNPNPRFQALIPITIITNIGVYSIGARGHVPPPLPDFQKTLKQCTFFSKVVHFFEQAGALLDAILYKGRMTT